MKKVAVTDKSLVILNYLKANTDKVLTAAGIAEEVGMEKKAVDGIITSGLCKKGYAERIPGTAETSDGVKAVKIVRATAEGLAYDHEAAMAIDAENAAAEAAEKAAEKAAKDAE